MNQGWTGLGQKEQAEELEWVLQSRVGEEDVGCSPGFDGWANWDTDASAGEESRMEEGSKYYV